MFPCGQRDQRIVGRATVTPLRAHSMRKPAGASREHERLAEVLVGEADRIRCRHPRIIGQPGQHRVRFRQAVATEAQRPATRPRGDLPMMLMTGNHRRYRDAGVDRHPHDRMAGARP